MKIFENLVRIEDFSNFGKNWRFLKIWKKLKAFEILIKLEDYSSFSQNWRYLRIWSKLKIFQISIKIEDFWKLDKIFEILVKKKKIKKGSYAGIWTPQSYGHPSKYWWGSMLLKFLKSTIWQMWIQLSLN